MISQNKETHADVGMGTNPFPGLRPFGFDESHLFFGRDGQSEQLIVKLGRTRFLAVVGTSGSGKSSLVRAGLLPALLGGFMPSAGSGWRIAILRPGNDPIGNLARALSATDVFGSEIEENAAIQSAVTEATLRRGSLGLVNTVRQAVMPSNENLLVVVDQFEEVFRFGRIAEGEGYLNDSAAFVKLVLEASHQRDVPIYIVMTMRSDFLGDCAQFWDFPEAINESQYLIPRLTRDQLREAITGPVAVGGGEITPRLVNRLLNDVGDNPDQLPILQHALMRTWDEWKNKRPAHRSVHEGEAMDLCCYEAIGGMAEALSRHADEAFRELPDDRSREVGEKLFKCLTEKGPDNREIRRPVALQESCAVVEATDAEMITVIETFRQTGRSFLMPPAEVKLDGDSLIDISHESFIRNWKGGSQKKEEKRLREWVEDEARSARIYRRLAETAELHREGKAALWDDPDLALALDWKKTNKPNKDWARRYHRGFDTAIEFLQASEKKARKARLLKWLLAMGLLLAVVTVGVAIWRAFEAVKEQGLEASRRAQAERSRKAAVGTYSSIVPLLSELALDYSDYQGTLNRLDRALQFSRRSGDRNAEGVTLTNIGEFYRREGQYAVAQANCQHALAILEEKLGPKHPYVANVLNKLAQVYSDQRKYVEAEPLFIRAQAILQETLGPESTYLADSFKGLGEVYQRQGKSGEVEQYYKRALAMDEGLLSKEHQRVAIDLTYLGSFYHEQGRYSEAEPLFERALTILEKALEKDDPAVADTLSGVAALYAQRSKYTRAEPIFKRAIEIHTRLSGANSPQVAGDLSNLANLYAGEGKYAEATQLYERSLSILRGFGQDSPNEAVMLNNLAFVYNKQKRFGKSEQLITRALEIQFKVLAENERQNSPDVALSLNNLADCYRGQHKYDEAKQHYESALSIREKALGKDNPDVAATLDGLALLYYEQKKYTEAEPLFQRALSVREKSLGGDHPDVAETLDHYSELLRITNRVPQAAEMKNRADAIRARRAKEN
jgi:tetratricopeptide (TPR) repeat protein